MSGGVRGPAAVPSRAPLLDIGGVFRVPEKEVLMVLEIDLSDDLYCLAIGISDYFSLSLSDYCSWCVEQCSRDIDSSLMSVLEVEPDEF